MRHRGVNNRYRKSNIEEYPMPDFSTFVIILIVLMLLVGRFNKGAGAGYG
jgi:hypothetical protein